MPKMIALRIDDALIEQVDRERKRHAFTRAKVIKEALRLWLDREQIARAVELHRDGYLKAPVKDQEFGPLLGAQRWPK